MTYSFYDEITGLFSGRRFSGSERLIVKSTPAGMRAIEGRFDRLSQRVDIATGAVIDFQPPAPDNDHEWRENVVNGRPRWVKKASVRAAEQRDKAARSRIAELEASQQRAIREHLLGDAAAAQRLRDIDDEIKSLRSDLIRE
jgi:hypothetical protein